MSLSIPAKTRIQRELTLLSRDQRVILRGKHKNGMKIRKSDFGLILVYMNDILLRYLREFVL